jgi:hypothetical protein
MEKEEEDNIEEQEKAFCDVLGLKTILAFTVDAASVFIQLISFFSLTFCRSCTSCPA